MRPPFPAVPYVVWFYVVLCCAAYSNYGVFTGHMTGFDDPVRLTQVLEWVNGAGFYDHTLMRANPPEGLTTIWSRLVDIPIAISIIIAECFTDQRTAALTSTVIIPFLELGVLFRVAQYFVRPLVGKRYARLAPLFIMFTTVLNVRYFSIAGFHTGEASHRAWYVILDLLLFGAASRLSLGFRKSVAVAGLSIGLLLGVGIEGIPIIAATSGLLAIVAWYFSVPRVAYLGSKAAALGAFGGLCLLPVYRPLSNLSVVSYADPSVLGACLVGSASLFLLIEGYILTRVKEPHSLLGAVMLLFVVALMALGLITAFPGLLDGPAAGLSAAERQLAFHQHFEVKPLLEVASGAIDFISLVAPTLIALAIGVLNVALTSSRRRQRQYVMYLGFVVATGVMAQFLARYIHHALTSATAWLLFGWLKTRAWFAKDKNYGLKMLASFIVLGPLFMLIVPAIDSNQHFASDLLLFPARNQRAPTLECDYLSLAKYLNQNYSSQTLLSVPSWDSANFLFNTNLRIDFVALYPSHDKFIDNMVFFNTQDPDEAKTIAMSHRINLVAACRYSEPIYQPELSTRGSRAPMFLELLQDGTTPPWLRRVKNVPGNYLLYEIIIDKSTTDAGMPTPRSPQAR